MASLLRPTGAAVVAALLMASAASASTLKVAAARGSFTVTTAQSAGVYRTTVLVPEQYTLRTGRKVTGSALVTTAGSTLRGSLESVAPAPYDNDDCAANVGWDHAAVWLVRVAGARLPVYVDAGPGGTTLLTWCASAATGLRVEGVTLSVRGAFDPPAARGALTWLAEFDNGTTQQARAAVHR